MAIKDWPGGTITDIPVEPSGNYEDSAASGVWTVDQVSNYVKQDRWPTPGNIDPAKYVEGVFSTYLYTGNNTGTNTQNIVNGIDLAGEGGAVWIKTRNVAWNHGIWDTETDGGNLYTNTTDAQQSNDDLASFNSDGFGVSSAVGTGFYNFNDQPQVSWTFRKKAKFFDVVTYTGNGVAGRAVPHNLNGTVGFAVVKRLDSGTNWEAQHISIDLTANKGLYLNLTDTLATHNNVWNSTHATSTDLILGNSSDVNGVGGSFVAYLWASDAGGFGDDGTESIIKCGSFTNNSASVGVEVNCGFEPQWLLIKGASTGSGLGNWVIIDSMRGASVDSQQRLYPNASTAEGSSNWFKFTSQGFTPNTYFDGDLIYIAIRRPMMTPTAGTEVFAMDTLGSTGDGNQPGYRSPFPVDMGLKTSLTGNQRQISTRLLQGKELLTESTAAEAASASKQFDYMNGTDTSTATSSVNMMWMFKRATGFMDVVAYTGNGSTRTISHNLGVAPEMMIIKARESLSPYVAGWVVYHSGISPQDSIYLNQNGGSSGASFQFASTSPTSSVFTLGSAIDVNMTGKNFISYHFATLAGVSKVGSYTGTGADLNVDCGFSAGARFILIKRTDSTGDWYVYDSLRGIVAGNDPYFFLNNTAAQVTNTDYIDPLSSGFTVTSSAPAALNASGGTYIFLAIA